MFIIVVTSAKIRVITLVVVIAVFRVGGELCLLFGIPSFSISVFNGLTVLVPDKLSNSGFINWMKACLTKPSWPALGCQRVDGSYHGLFYSPQLILLV